MAETVNQEENIERTFTQADVDRIVADRLKRDREKYADYDVLKEKAAKLELNDTPFLEYRSRISNN